MSTVRPQSSGASQHGQQPSSGQRHDVSQQQHEHAGHINMSEGERLGSLIGGSALLLFGLSRLSLTNIAVLGLGGMLLYRGATGHCSITEKLSMSQ